MTENKEQPPKQTKKPKDPIWKHARKKNGALFQNAEELWDAACEYFQWCDDNDVETPVSVSRYHKDKGGSKELKKSDQQSNMLRPYTLYGLCVFAGIKNWNNFKMANMPRDGFEEVILTIENVCASQLLDGALTGVFRENITSRVLGLADNLNQQGFIEIDANSGETTGKFQGFNFLPHTEGLQNSDSTRIASGEKPLLPEAEFVEVPKEPVYAEIVEKEPEQTLTI